MYLLQVYAYGLLMPWLRLKMLKVGNTTTSHCVKLDKYLNM